MLRLYMFSHQVKGNVIAGRRITRKRRARKKGHEIGGLVNLVNSFPKNQEGGIS